MTLHEKCIDINHSINASYSTDTSCSDKEYYVDNLKSIKNKNIDDKYKDENSQHHNSNKIIINKTKE